MFSSAKNDDTNTNTAQYRKIEGPSEDRKSGSDMFGYLADGFTVLSQNLQGGNNNDEKDDNQSKNISSQLPTPSSFSDWLWGRDLKASAPKNHDGPKYGTFG
ncbi:MAG: hypothetical protein ACE365_03455 [Gammaproteobacteria bacterium]